MKEEPEKSQHMPPAGSVDNPVAIDDDDDDEVIRHSVTTAKRKMGGEWVVSNPLRLVEELISVPPPGGENPGKRLKPVSYHLLESKDSDPPSATHRCRPFFLSEPRSHLNN